MHVPFKLSDRAHQTEDQPISYFMQQAVENPQLISLAAGQASRRKEIIGEPCAGRPHARSERRMGKRACTGTAPLTANVE